MTPAERKVFQRKQVAIKFHTIAMAQTKKIKEEDKRKAAYE